jgi:hypothetical protein
MKSLRTILCTILVLSLASTFAWALTFGPFIIRECPKCKTHLEEKTYNSWNTFGARFWTDAKMMASGFPDKPWLVKCPKCKSVFWLDDARELGRWDIGSGDENKWPNAVDPDYPLEGDYLSIVQDPNLSHAKKLYARREAWWVANDTRRMSETNTVSFTEEQTANLQKLVALLDDKHPNQRLMKAEALRELGQFGDCIKLLSSPFEKQGHADAATFIRSLAEQKVTVVREIAKEKKPNKAIDSDKK